MENTCINENFQREAKMYNPKCGDQGANKKSSQNVNLNPYQQNMNLHNSSNHAYFQ